jgi:hypothetical protein
MDSRRALLLEPSAVEAPSLFEPVTAYRSWRVVDGRLRSPYRPVFWDQPTLEASCVHPAPGSGCACGIHAKFEPDREFPKVDYRGVAGIVTLWGRIEVDRDGMRAEHARVEALALYARSSARLKSALFKIADELDVDLIDLDEIEAAAARYGTPLPGLLPAGSS